MTSLYQPGDSWLHRLPAGLKLAALLLLSLGVLLLDRPSLAVATVGAALGLLVSSGVPLRLLARPLLWLLVVAAVLALVQLVAAGPAAAVVASSRVLTMALLAWTVTLTTRVSALMAVVVRALGPLRPLGVRPEVVAMTLGLAIRCIPLLTGIVDTAQEARRARGARPGVTSLAVPVVVRSVRLADEVSEALLARGYDPRA